MIYSFFSTSQTTKDVEILNESPLGDLTAVSANQVITPTCIVYNRAVTAEPRFCSLPNLQSRYVDTIGIKFVLCTT